MSVMNMGRKIYLAGPLFTSAERNFNTHLAWALCLKDHSVFLPQEFQSPTSDAIFQSDLSGLQWCDTVVAILEGTDPDSGTAWECGWAFGVGKPVIGVRTDFRTCSNESVNLMLTCSVNKMLVMPPDTKVTDIAFTVDRELKLL
jgi:nucleoside 2-deoxyribosyltransferase